MFLAILAFVLIAGIAFYQTVQGLFSALIMTILSIISAAVAFNYYEPLAQNVFYNRFSAYADATCLMALFAVTLIVLRIVFDLVVRGNVVFSPWVDRIGGGVLGVITGMILTGVLLICLQLLPWGASVLTYRPFDDALQRDSRAAPFCPDDFTLGLVKVLSAGSMSGSTRFGDVHKDLLLEAYCARNKAGKNGRTDARPDSAKVLGVYATAPSSLEGDVPASPLLDRGVLDKTLVVRLGINKDAMDEEDAVFRLPATHFCLATDKLNYHYPVAYLTGREVIDREGNVVPAPWRLHPAKVGEDDEDAGGKPQVGALIIERPAQSKGGDLVVDWVYRIPTKERPMWLLFRRAARMRLSPPKNEAPPTEGALARKRTGS